MNEMQLHNKLQELLSLPSENEVVEFKEAKDNFDSREIGKYFSALSNEANLSNSDYAWLVFGVNDKKEIVGTNYRPLRKHLDNLKHELAEKINNRLTFVDIHEIQTTRGRVIMFQIPPAPRGIPVSFGGFFYGREGDSIGALNIEEIERIRKQIIQTDWSMEVCKYASLNDLDFEALQKARQNFKVKHPRLADEIEHWDTMTFLNKARLAIRGELTNTAIILLGKSEAEHLIAPAIARITWVLKNTDNVEKDYEHFSCPFILAIDRVFMRIRNLKYRYLKEGTLFPEEIDRYAPFNIKEALSNCIAHQDYRLSGRINVVEIEDEQLIFSNMGDFLPGSVENVLSSDQPPAMYRNPFLANAMVNLNMIDTVGSGIKRMFKSQRDRFFPMPEYTLSNGMVKVIIYGKVLDMGYARVLARLPDLSLNEIILLDKVQKQKELSDAEILFLRARNLIEGRKPHFIISEHIAVKTRQVGDYLKTRGFDKEYYKKLVCELVQKNNNGTSKKEIRDLLWHKLPDLLTDSQKESKISNILTALKREGKITNIGSDVRPIWISSI